MPRHIVLVVDDEEDARRELGDFLTALDFRPVLTGDGLEGVRAFEADEPDLVITDIKMPHQDGYELIRQIRARDPDVPIVAITGHFSELDVEQARRLGAASVLRKPVDPHILGDILRHFLS